MKELTIEQKKKSFGGVAPVTIAWVAIAGLGILTSGINSLLNHLTGSSNQKYSGNSNFYSSSRGSAMIRMSMIPSRSNISFWV